MQDATSPVEPMLWEGEQRYVELVRSLPIGITVHNTAGERVYANPQAMAMLGLAGQSHPGLTLHDPALNFVDEHGEPLTRAQMPVPRALTSGQAVHDMVIGIDGVVPGRRQWLLVNAIPQLRSDGSVQHVTRMLVDITHWREAEQQAAAGRDALAESALHTQAILDNMVDAVITIDAQGHMESFNKAAGPMFGFVAEEVIGRHVSLLIPEPRKTRPGTQQSHYQALGEAHVLGRPREMMARRKSGEMFPISLAVTRYSHRGRTTYVGLVRDISESRQAALALEANARQLKEMSKRVLLAQESERRRVARELHDELGQSLTAIKINLQSSARFKDRPADELNQENLEIVEQALQQVRRLATALRPSVLDDLGLVPALRGLCEQSAQRSGFAVHFHPALPESRLGPEVETTCFRIVQESLTNIARHAAAVRVDIDLFHDGDALMLVVRDDGCGFDVAAMQARAQGGASMGVLAMKERAELIGGSLDIQSRPGAGTTLTLRCPMFRPLQD